MRTSMLVDVAGNRVTEIDVLNGAIVSLGKSFSLRFVSSFYLLISLSLSVVFLLSHTLPSNSLPFLFLHNRL
jgi:hypothetical protein